MAFMGETTEVGVAELLSVLARRGHTGRLSISAEEDDTQIYLNDGKVSLVSSTRRDLRLGRVLVRLGAINGDGLDIAVREQDQDGKGRALGQILVEQGHVTTQDLAQAAEEQCIEALAGVIVAKHGSFVFNRDFRPLIKEGLLALNADGIVLEASRRADEMTRLRGLLPPPHARLALTPKANAQTSPLGVAESLVVDALRRDPCTLAKLTELLPIEEVALWRGIVRLRERGMIYAVADERPTREEPRSAAASSDRSLEDILQLGAAGKTATTKDVSSLADIRAGTTADADAATAISTLVQEVVAARNERQTLQAFSRYSDDYFRRHGMLTTFEIEALRRTGPPLPLAEQETIVAVRDVRTLHDGRASAIVISRRQNAGEIRKIMIFSRSGFVWRIDADLGD